MRGADLVVDGPPGTGKSQTIANIIAETLAAGKTVLFVSAKVAALEVVKRRLDQCGLGDFCLELHSHKANKKEVVAELGRCLDLAAGDTPETDAQLRELASSRGKLNDLVTELHAVRQPLGWSAFRVHGELARIEATAEKVPSQKAGVKRTVSRSRIAIADPFAKDAEYVRKGSEILAGLADCHSVLDAPAGHPWRGCKVASATHAVRDDVAHLLREFVAAIPPVEHVAEDFAGAGFASPPVTVLGWKAAEVAAQRVLASPLFPSEWFQKDAKAAAEAAIELDRATREARDHQVHLPEFDPAALWTIENVVRSAMLPTANG